ncbi:MAG: DJ-1/PfpI family protein, partial [Hyphomicrobiales bacterium]
LNISFDKVKHKEYDGLIIPGGRAPEYIKLDERVINTIIEIDKERKPIIAISKGIQLLTAANIIEGMRVTSCPSSINEIKLSRGKYVSVDKDNIIVDHNIITGYSWHANPKLMQEFMRQLGTKIYI